MSLLYNNTEGYCDLPKPEMAAEASACPWPYVPPNCEVTWTEHVGAPIVYISQVIYGLLFAYSLVLLIGVQRIIKIKQKKSNRGFWDRSANEWNSSYNFCVCILRLFVEIDWGNTFGVLDFKLKYILLKTISGVSIKYAFQTFCRHPFNVRF